MNAKLQAALAPLATRWRGLEPPVQRGLAVGGGLAVLLLWWAFAWLPVMRARADLIQRQPGWATQVSEMRALADEARRLQQIAPIAAKEPVRSLADKAALQALFGPEYQVRSADGRAFQLSVANVPYAQWLEKVDQALARHRLKIVSIQLKTVAAQADERTPVQVEWTMADDV